MATPDAPTVARSNLLTKFQRDGYVLLPKVYSPADIEPLKRVINRAVDNYARELKREGKISDLHEDLPFERRLAAVLNGTGIGLRV